MKLIEKATIAPSGNSLHWHAVQNVFVDILGGFFQITYGSWADRAGAESLLRPEHTGQMDVYFQTWNPDMLLSTAEILVSDGELEGGLIIVTDTSNPQPSASIAPIEQPRLPEGYIFDVGAMP